ncbi:MAG: transposase, partial [Bacteroidetes bacterium]
MEICSLGHHREARHTTLARRYELSDQQFTRIEDVLSPAKTSRRGRPRRDDRSLLNDIFRVLCSSAAWRDLPERFGPWQTVRYHRVFTSYALILSSAVI